MRGVHDRRAGAHVNGHAERLQHLVLAGALVDGGLGVKGVTLPMIMAAIGIIASMIGMAFVRTGEKATQESLLMALRKGIFIAAGLVMFFSCVTIKMILGAEYAGVA